MEPYRFWQVYRNSNPLLLEIYWFRIKSIIPMIESLRTTQFSLLDSQRLVGFLSGGGGGGGRRRGTKNIRPRVRARKNRMEPVERRSFLGTRPSCLPAVWPHRQPSKWRIIGVIPSHVQIVSSTSKGKAANMLFYERQIISCSSLFISKDYVNNELYIIITYSVIRKNKS